MVDWLWICGEEKIRKVLVFYRHSKGWKDFSSYQESPEYIADYVKSISKESIPLEKKK